jgi:putative oxidoreductase
VRVATTVVRLSLALMYLSHSLVLKVGTYGFTGTAQFFVSVGLPAFLAYVTIASEAVGGVLLLANVRASVVSLALIPFLVGATFVHAPNGWVFTSPGGGWEYPLFLIAVSAVLALLAWPAARDVPAANPVVVARDLARLEPCE